ncbi:ROK family protein [Enterococcus innesii]|uniref:ROK family protein n=1 Tax=Enterococcus innesii TaxID=2839759 RepID=UPI003B5B226D
MAQLVYLGIDIGGTHIKTGWVKNNEVNERQCFPTPATLKAFNETIKMILQTYARQDSFTKVAIAVPGSIDETGTVFFGGALPYLDGVNLPDLLCQLSEEKVTTITVENDAKAAVLGEMKAGNLQGIQNGAAIILGTGVGVGICLDGKLYRGNRGQAGEVSFMIRDRRIMDRDSFVGVGLSAVGLIERLAACLKVTADGPLVFETLEKTSDPEAEALLSTYTQEVAVLCFDLQCLLGLEKIVIGGGISRRPRVIDAITTSYQGIFKTAAIIEKTLQSVAIQAAYFQADANLIGAVKEEPWNE